MNHEVFDEGFLRMPQCNKTCAPYVFFQINKVQTLFENVSENPGFCIFCMLDVKRIAYTVSTPSDGHRYLGSAWYDYPNPSASARATFLELVVVFFWVGGCAFFEQKSNISRHGFLDS